LRVRVLHTPNSPLLEARARRLPGGKAFVTRNEEIEHGLDLVAEKMVAEKEQQRYNAISPAVAKHAPGL
jgi:hypothetical protein